jgi:predicted nuclease with TOPRIM domain
VETWLLVLSAAGGGLIVGLVVAVMERLWPTRANRLDAEAKFRGDLLENVDDLRARLSKVEGDVASWRDKYYSLTTIHIALQEDYLRLKGRYDILEAEVKELRGLCQAAGLSVVHKEREV